jgi:hypothetical protein
MNPESCQGQMRRLARLGLRKSWRIAFEDFRVRKGWRGVEREVRSE